MAADYYEVLGVARGASGDEIKAAFRKAALRWHPDRNPGDATAEAKFKEASEAYQVLSDPDRRAHFDRFGTAPQSNGMPDFQQINIEELFSDLLRLTPDDISALVKAHPADMVTAENLMEVAQR